MKKALTAAVVAAALLAVPLAARATSSTVYWTPSTTYVQPYAVPHLTYDSYAGEKGGLQNDYGLTVGVLPFERLQAEIGIDSFLPGLQKNNLYLNAKLGVPEGAFGSWQPGITGGIYAAGFKKDISNYNILHAEVGKTLPVVGNVTVGVYHGLNDKLLVSSTGSKEQTGFMASYTSPDIVLNLTGLNKLNVIADYQSGKNAFGAYGAGLAVYFTPAIDVITGPVWFNDKDLMKAAYGTDFMWTVQLDVDFDLVAPKPAPKS